MSIFQQMLEYFAALGYHKIKFMGKTWLCGISLYFEQVNESGKIAKALWGSK